MNWVKLESAKQEWSRLSQNDWNNSSLANLNTTYNYDPAGNISDLTRKDLTGNTFDDFTYHYNANTNQLNYIEDANVDDLISTQDIDNQSIENYEYDKDGRLTKDVHDGITNIIWTRDNRPKQVTKNFNGINEVINYHYDFQEFKIIQTINRSDSVFKQHYVRDPQGSVLAIYTDTSATNYQKLTLSELSIYGSSRLGTYNIDFVLWENGITPFISNVYTQKLGLKRYELSNHLGNVQTVITDRKLVDTNAGGQITAWKVDIISVSDYYAYGMKITERSWGKDARYQYNGKEQDKGTGRYNFDGRMYDERSCRWMSLDPQAAKYAGISPYVGFNNNPIYNIDPDGNSGIAYLVKDKETGQTKIVIKSTFVVYQYKSLVTQDGVDLMMSEMQQTWNNLNASVTYEGVTYPVEFQFSGSLVTPTEALGMAKTNKDPEINFVLYSDKITSSSGSDIGSNSFELKDAAFSDLETLSDGVSIDPIKSPYTKSHELVAHGLGWFDYENNNEHDLKGSHKGVMYSDPAKQPKKTPVQGYTPSIWNKPNTMDVGNILKPISNGGYFDFKTLLKNGSAVVGKSRPDNVIVEEKGGNRLSNKGISYSNFKLGERGIRRGNISDHDH